MRVAQMPRRNLAERKRRWERYYRLRFGPSIRAAGGPQVSTRTLTAAYDSIDEDLYLLIRIEMAHRRADLLQKCSESWTPLHRSRTD